MNIKYELRIVIEEMFWINFLTFILGLQYLWISEMFFLFEEDMNPVWDPTSNAVTDGLSVVMSDRKC